MEVTKREKALISESVLSLYAGRFREADKADAIQMLMELLREDRPPQLGIEDARLILLALEKFSQDTTELEQKFKDAIDEYRSEHDS